MYFRDENRIFRVAFSVCENCGRFFNFHDWKNRKRSMPYFNSMKGQIKAKFLKGKEREKANWLRIDRNRHCIEGKNHQYTKLYVKNLNSQRFVGYLCKDCKTAYFVKTKFLKLDESGNLGPYPLNIDYEDSELETITRTIKVAKKDLKKLNHLIQKSNLEIH